MVKYGKLGQFFVKFVNLGKIWKILDESDFKVWLKSDFRYICVYFWYSLGTLISNCVDFGCFSKIG